MLTNMHDKRLLQKVRPTGVLLIEGTWKGHIHTHTTERREHGMQISNTNRLKEEKKKVFEVGLEYILSLLFNY